MANLHFTALFITVFPYNRNRVCKKQILYALLDCSELLVACILNHRTKVWGGCMMKVNITPGYIFRTDNYQIWSKRYMPGTVTPRKAASNISDRQILCAVQDHNCSPLGILCPGPSGQPHTICSPITP